MFNEFLLFLFGPLFTIMTPSVIRIENKLINMIVAQLGSLLFSEHIRYLYVSTYPF